MKTSSNIDFNIYTYDTILSIINKNFIDAKYIAENNLELKINQKNIVKE